MKMPRTRRIAPPTRLIVVTVLAIILIVSVLGWQRWQAASSNSQQWRSEARRAYAAATTIDEETDRATRLQALTRLAALTDAQPTCEGEWWYGWVADVLPPASRAAQRCQTDVAVVAPVALQAEQLSTYLRQEAELAPIISSLTIDSAKSDWQANAAAAARQAETAVARLEPSEAFKPVQQCARQQMKTIGTRWQALEEASKKQDRKAYEAAVDGLDNAYLALSVIGDVSDQELGRLLEQLTLAGKKL